MTVDQERVGDVSRDDTSLVHIELIDVLDQVDAFALRGVGWFDDPYVPLWFCLLKFLVVCVELMEFVWKDIGVWYEIELGTSESLLHLDNIVTESILASDLIALREMIDPLELIQAFIEVTLTGATSPKDVPFVRVGEVEAISLEEGSDQFGVSSEKLVQHLTVINMVSSLRHHGWWCVV